MALQRMLQVNQSGELIAVAGSQDTEGVGWVPPGMFPVDDQGRLKIAGLSAGEASSTPPATTPGSSTPVTNTPVIISQAASLSATHWTDKSGAYYLKVDNLNEEGTVDTTWYDADSGDVILPGYNPTPVSQANKTIVSQIFYDIVGRDLYTTYQRGDIVLLVQQFNGDTNTWKQSWINTTKQTMLSTAPAAEHRVQHGTFNDRKRFNLPKLTTINTLTETSIYPILSDTVYDQGTKTIIPLLAGAYNDINSMTLVNNSPMAVTVELRGSKGGTAVRAPVRLSAAGSVGDRYEREFITPFQQPTKDSEWTAIVTQASVGAVDVRVELITSQRY